MLVTTLTKRMAEDLTEYLHDHGIRVRYMHSDIETLERIEIIRDLRLGAFDVLVGINLLREGLDIPECALVAVLDADKEGFLRSKTSLVQTIGRAARNLDGRVILYADRQTDSLEYAIGETNRRRERQQAYNTANGITPESVRKGISDVLGSVYEHDYVTVDTGVSGDRHLVGKSLSGHVADLGSPHADGGRRVGVRGSGAPPRRNPASGGHGAGPGQGGRGAEVRQRVRPIEIQVVPIQETGTVVAVQLREKAWIRRQTRPWCCFRAARIRPRVSPGR